MTSNYLQLFNDAFSRRLIRTGLSLAFTLGISLGIVGGAVAQESAASAPVATEVLSPAPTAPAMVSGLPPAEAVANPYGLAALWAQGDWVARGTLVLLLIMSVASWYILINRLVIQSKNARYAKEAQKVFAGSIPVRQGVGRLSVASPYRFISNAAVEAELRFGALNGQVDLSTWLSQNIENSVSTVYSRQQSGLAELATIGSTAPFVGLFGTVWGIYNALVKIGATGQASLDKVAGPVGEALIMTAIGLAVAVPAVLSYNWLVRRNRQSMEIVKNYASGLHTELLANPPRRTSSQSAA